MSDEGGGFLFFVALFIWGIWEYGSVPFSDEVTIYVQVQKCDDDGKQCQWENLKRINFKAFVDQQSVVRWLDGDEFMVDRLKNCVVVDRNNWKCTENYYPIQFYKGEYSGVYTRYDEFDLVYKTNWWFKKIMGWFD